MKITLDQEVCQRHAQCVMAAPQIFAFNEAGDKVIVLDPSPPEELHDAARDAADLCPIQAIEIIED